jgi:hypothetical protein
MIGGFVLAVGMYQLPGDRAAAQDYTPQQQTILPPQPNTFPQQQAAPSAPMCIYPSGASCPMTTAVPPGTSCTCQQVWPGTGQVATGGPSGQSQQSGGMTQQGYSGSQGAPAQQQPSFVTPPPPAGMVPIQ